MAPHRLRRSPKALQLRWLLQELQQRDGAYESLLPEEQTVLDQLRSKGKYAIPARVASRRMGMAPSNDEDTMGIE